MMRTLRQPCHKASQCLNQVRRRDEQAWGAARGAAGTGPQADANLCLTSSNLYAIIAKALKMASVGPVMVTILSGQFPSEMLILAPL